MKKERFLSVLLALLVSITVAAQSSGLKGTVTDESGEPVIGASVIVKGQPQTGTITNFDGEFVVNVAEGTTLVVSYVGYSSQEVRARNGMNVVLKEDASVLNDVVVIGYGRGKHHRQQTNDHSQRRHQDRTQTCCRSQYGRP